VSSGRCFVGSFPYTPVLAAPCRIPVTFVLLPETCRAAQLEYLVSLSALIWRFLREWIWCVYPNCVYEGASAFCPKRVLQQIGVGLLVWSPIIYTRAGICDGAMRRDLWSSFYSRREDA